MTISLDRRTCLRLWIPVLNRPLPLPCSDTGSHIISNAITMYSYAC